MLRIKHYIKNLFVFIPLFFSMSFTNKEAVFSSILVFFEFCLVSSCIYIINDIVDLDKDRQHPKKKNRPIASGQVSVPTAEIVAIVLMVLALVLAYVSKRYYSLITIALYFVLNLAYSFYLKKIALVDVFVIAIGFLMRIYAGAFAIDVQVTSWLLLTALSLSLFLGFGKRYGEKKRVGDNSSRDVLVEYNTNSLKIYLTITLTLTIVFYSLYCAIGSSILGEHGIITVPVVMFAMFRYFATLEKEDADGDPTDTVLKDKVVQACVLLYIVIAVLLIWR